MIIIFKIMIILMVILVFSVRYNKSNDGIGRVLADHVHYYGDHDHDRNPHTDTNIRIVILVSVFG